MRYTLFSLHNFLREGKRRLLPPAAARQPLTFISDVQKKSRCRCCGPGSLPGPILSLDLLILTIGTTPVTLDPAPCAASTPLPGITAECHWSLRSSKYRPYALL